MYPQTQLAHNLGGSDEKPPSNKIDLGFGSGVLPSDDTLVGRLANLWELWTSAWSLCPARTSLHNRCLLISGNLQER